MNTHIPFCFDSVDLMCLLKRLKYKTFVHKILSAELTFSFNAFHNESTEYKSDFLLGIILTSFHIHLVCPAFLNYLLEV